jgi:NADH-quinone oxidoreductase subunit L
VLIGVFVTALYSFRLFFMVFHGQERMDEKTRSHLHESPWVVTVPLVLLAIPSLLIGWPTIGPLLFGDYFGSAIFVLSQHDVLGEIGAEFHGPLGFLLHGLASPVLLLAFSGVAVAWYLYLKQPQIPAVIKGRMEFLYRLLDNKYYLDDFNEQVIARGSRLIGQGLWRAGDAMIIDGILVNGTANSVGRFAGVLRRLQTGYLYHYAFAMVIGLVVLVGWIVW